MSNCVLSICTVLIKWSALYYCPETNAKRLYDQHNCAMKFAGMQEQRCFEHIVAVLGFTNIRKYLFKYISTYANLMQFKGSVF